MKLCTIRYAISSFMSRFKPKIEGKSLVERKVCHLQMMWSMMKFSQRSAEKGGVRLAEELWGLFKGLSILKWFKVKFTIQFPTYKLIIQVFNNPTLKLFILIIFKITSEILFNLFRLIFHSTSLSDNIKKCLLKTLNYKLQNVKALVSLDQHKLFNYVSSQKKADRS